MFEDRRLINRIKEGDSHALRVVYETHEQFLFSIAANLLDDGTEAADVVQDVFVSFAQSVNDICLRSSLRNFLATCVANRARDIIRRKRRQPTVALTAAANVSTDDGNPLQLAMQSEAIEKVRAVFSSIPYDQREVIVLRLHGGMKFRQIARLQHVSVKTALSRWRYGLDKIRALLNGETGR